MRKFILAFLFLFILGVSNIGFAQEEDSTNTEESWDNNNDSENEDWEDTDWDSSSHNHGFGWTHDFNWPDFEFHGRPTISAAYGVSEMGIKSLNPDFNKPGSAEIRLGYSNLSEKDDYVIKYHDKYVFLGNLTKDLSNETKDNVKLNAEIWRFGFGTLEGYGYKFGSSSIIPYTSNSVVWTRLKLDKYGLNSLITQEDVKALELFNEAFRFGTTTEGGVRIQPIPLFSINAGYERTVVFPRHLFWKHLGSMTVEWIGLGAVDAFVHEVMNESPAAAPIVNFLLKNALSYGIYQLRREKMNWPFKSAEPLTFDTWKVGLTFTF